MKLEYAGLIFDNVIFVSVDDEEGVYIEYMKYSGSLEVYIDHSPLPDFEIKILDLHP